MGFLDYLQVLWLPTAIHGAYDFLATILPAGIHSLILAAILPFLFAVGSLIRLVVYDWPRDFGGSAGAFGGGASSTSSGLIGSGRSRLLLLGGRIVRSQEGLIELGEQPATPLTLGDGGG